MSELLSKSPLLSDPMLDELYAIRRILVGQHNVKHKQGDNFAILYYRKKVEALDAAIKAYIESNSIPVEFQEAELVVTTVRIPT